MMLVLLLALALFAGLRGWFPWSALAFAAVYAFTFIDFGHISYETSLARFGIGMTAGSMLEYTVGVTLAAMTIFERD
jgi:hypothetical protein